VGCVRGDRAGIMGNISVHRSAECLKEGQSQPTASHNNMRSFDINLLMLCSSFVLYRVRTLVVWCIEEFAVVLPAWRYEDTKPSSSL
jgi:hypothetical protein